jgi:uncharacterized protein (DUF305 family)
MKWARFWLPALLVGAALLLASCGNAGSTGGGAGELATKDPLDKAFIDAMIPHHRSAIKMASLALRESENAWIKEIAGAIVDAREKEIPQMQRWREKWYPQA